MKEGKGTFLKEEKQLIGSVALKMNNLLKRIEIKKMIFLQHQIERINRLNSLGKIRETFDLTRERIRKIKAEAIKRPKRTSCSKILKTYLG